MLWYFRQKYTLCAFLGAIKNGNSRIRLSIKVHFLIGFSRGLIQKKNFRKKFAEKICTEKRNIVN
ncbi:MAG: hypothetical protein EAZ92_17585 [Candidatus Kapaibacterium sp.]|nr:MAG: hypothetical protein EAZ92_17585 [Candidatus Kapabacteria bacterium]